MIKFKDFVPEEMSEGGFFTAAKYEELNEALYRANEWILDQDIDVFNIETVVLPNMHDNYEEGSEDTDLRTSGEMGSTWHQFIRVWYQ